MIETIEGALEDDRPILTICIPTFNRASLLDRCLEELEQLPFPKKSIEIIVADNASTDNTSDVVRSREQRLVPHYHFEHFRQESNVSVISNLFSAMKLAKGKYVSMLGDDDRLLPETADLLLRMLIEAPEFSLAVECDIVEQRNEIFDVVEFQELMEASGRFFLNSPTYKSGNAWAGIYNTTLLKGTLEDFRLEEFAVRNVWAQHALALVMLNNTLLPAVLTNFLYGEEFQAKPYKRKGLTVLKSYSDFLESLVFADSLLKLGALDGVYDQIVRHYPSPSYAYLRDLLTTWPGKSVFASSTWTNYSEIISTKKQFLSLRIISKIFFSTGLATLLTKLADLVKSRRPTDSTENYWD